MKPAHDLPVRTDDLEANDDFARISGGPVGRVQLASTGASVFRLCGFDLLDRPTLSSQTIFPGETVTARTTVPLRRAMIGGDVVVLFEGGDPRLPIVVGVIEPFRAAEPVEASSTAPALESGDRPDRQVIEAEREVVLRCGDASITLTRAGKVVIKGNYVLSQSAGYNKIKGAAIDIN